MKDQERVRGWLLAQRHEKGLTQEQVAEQAGITRSYYTRIENGDHKVPVETAKRIAAALQMSWTLFYEN